MVEGSGGFFQKEALEKILGWIEGSVYYNQWSW